MRVAGVPHYILPAPSRIMETMIADWPLLFGSLLQTLKTTFLGLSLAIMGGVGLAVLLSLSRAIEYSLYPYAVVLQVTPVVAIAPLLLIYMPQETAVLTCAWIVAFFPILSNTTLGLQIGRPQPALNCSISTARRARNGRRAGAGQLPSRG